MEDEKYEYINEFYFLERDCFGYEFMYDINRETKTESQIEVNSGINKKSKIEKKDDYDIISKIEKIHRIINDFKDEYISRNMLDGKEFRIYARYNTGKIKKVIGRNKFPDGYNFLVSILKEGNENDEMFN